MKKLLLTALFLTIILIPALVLAQSNNTHTDRYTITLSATAGQDEIIPTACTVSTNGGTARTLAADCEIIAEGADMIYVHYDSTATANTSTDWSINIRGIGESGSSYPTASTDPTDTSYHEEDGLADAQLGGFGLTPSPYAIKIRTDENAVGGLVVAATVIVKVSWIKR